MYLEFKGHSCRYSVEQVLLLLFPNERPVYSSLQADLSSSAAVEAFWGQRLLTVTTRILKDGKTAKAVARAPIPENEFERERTLRRTVKRSFFLAAVRLTGAVPPWGALTGIRPAKLVRLFLEEGQSERQIIQTLMKKYAVRRDKAELCLQAAKVSLTLAEKQMENDISLYVGIPFCPSRCVYCSFVSHSIEKAHSLILPYLEGLYREIRNAGKLCRQLGLRVRTVYIGGGTPTILTASQLEELMSLLASCFDLSRLEEYTVEGGRPDTMTREKLRVLRRFGADRISINPQSMDDAVLQAVGRRHTAEDVVQAFHLARDVGFHLINMDLIAGLPLDTLEGFSKSLKQLTALGAENITVHTLARKRGADLKLANLPLPDGETVGEMVELAHGHLKKHGYEPYYLYRQKFMTGSFENVGWALPGTFCSYNVYMMEELHTVLSLGAGGVTKLIDQQRKTVRRICNPKYPYEYLFDLDALIREKDQMRTFYQKE